MTIVISNFEHFKFTIARATRLLRDKKSHLKLIHWFSYFCFKLRNTFSNFLEFLSLYYVTAAHDKICRLRSLMTENICETYVLTHGSWKNKHQSLGHINLSFSIKPKYQPLAKNWFLRETKYFCNITKAVNFYRWSWCFFCNVFSVLR